MKLVKQTTRGFEYRLSEEDVYSLCFLVKHFPLTSLSAVKISKTDRNPAEREALLNEYLAEHRDELKRRAQNLVRADKFKVAGDHQLYRISLQGRETMLQVLNDIRVESWKQLGEPENLDVNIVDLPKEKTRYYHLMYLAGYFEHHFLNLEDEPEED